MIYILILRSVDMESHSKQEMLPKYKKMQKYSLKAEWQKHHICSQYLKKNHKTFYTMHFPSV